MQANLNRHETLLEPIPFTRAINLSSRGDLTIPSEKATIRPTTTRPTEGKGIARLFGGDSWSRATAAHFDITREYCHRTIVLDARLN